MMIITCKISTLDGHIRMKNFVAAVRKKTLLGGFWSVKVNLFLTSSNCILSLFNGTSSVTQTKSGRFEF